MDLFFDHKLYLLLFSFHFVSVVVSQGKPRTPTAYYAVASSTAELPCIAGTSGDELRWVAEHEDDSLRGRTRSHIDNDDPDLFVNVIRDVQPSDAGTFVCSDGLDSSEVELVVIEPSHVLETQAETNTPDEIKVRWKAPLNNPDLVRGYNIYVKEVAESGKEVKFLLDSARPEGVEEYLLTDFFPGSTYEIQVAPLYLKGVDEVGETVEGPRSLEIRIKTPKFEAYPWKVTAEPWKNSTILVKWQPPKDEDSRGVDGYIVYYQGIGKKVAPSGEVTVTRPEAGNRWSAVLKGLKTRMRYKIHVAAFTGGSQKIEGRKSQEITIMHDGFNPELSIRAIPLSPDTVLVTLETVGGDKVDKLRILYSDDSAITWDRVDGYKNKENYAVVTGLQPRTKYFFMAKAQVNKKARSVVTHVVTPPAGLSTPANISVTAKTDSSVLVSWDYEGRNPAIGFIVLVEKLQPEGLFSPDKHQVVYKVNEALVPELDTGEKYQVKVEPFDVESVGRCGDPVLFQLAVSGDTTLPPPERTQPYFVDDQPEQLQINAGEDVKLSCTALGNPHPTVQWFKDGLPVGQSASRLNELVLSRVRESTVLTCRANNAFGAADRQTRVQVTPDVEEPRFLVRLPETLIIRRGAEVRQWCNATGSPIPTVTWYKDGAPVQSDTDVPGSNEFVEKRAARPFDLKCTARNPAGWTEAVVKVFIKELLRNPTIRTRLPRTIQKTEGEQLTISCSFNGIPIPLVWWSDSSTRLGDPMPGQNVLNITSVERSTVLTCRGENLLGTAEESVQLNVIPRQQLVPSDYKISLKAINESPSEVKVKWTVDRGNLNDIRSFHVKLATESGQFLLNKILSSDQRSINFRQLSPQIRYIVSLETVTSRGLVDNSTVLFTPAVPNTISNDRQPVMYLEIVEIRDNTARVDFSTDNLDPRQLHSYRLRVKDLDARVIGNTILDKGGLPPDSPTIALDRLKPNRNYQVIMDALSRDASTLLSTSANFFTPGPGQYGIPVFTQSDSPPESPPPPTKQPVVPKTTPRTTTVLTRRTLPTLAPRTTPPPRTTPEPTTTVSVATEPPSPAFTAGTTAEEPENRDYVMTAKVPNKTPYRVDIRWTVDRGPIENVRDFLVTIKGDRGQTLLQQKLPENQRYITIQSLSPNTKYFVNVKANGPEGVLVESDVAFQTDPATVVPDTSNPVLELEANEVRSQNARIDWTVINAEPDLVKSYRLQVLDNGPGGFNLLTQKLHASSQSLNLQQLQPNKRYHVIVDALAADNSVLMTSSLTFETASPNKYGVPVITSSATSRAALQPPRTEMARPEGRRQNTGTSPPELDFRINPEGASSTGLTWHLANVPDGAVTGYTLRVRNDRPDGNVLLAEKVPLASRYFKLDGLIKNRRYYLELDALSASGSTFIRAATPYTPGRSETPLQVTARLSESGPPQKNSPQSSDDKDEEDTVDDGGKPEIDLELNPVGHNQVKVNWTVVGGSRARPIASYKIRVNADGPQGHLLHENELRTNTLFYTISSLLEDKRYYVHLDALDKDGRVIEYVASPYLVPPPGHPVEPIRTSSAFNKKTATAQPVPKKDRLSDSGELAITKALADGPNAIAVEWYDVTTENGEPTSNTMVRYAEFKDNVRDQFQIQSVPAGQRKLTIRNLKPDTTYGIQVASMATSGQFVRWSKIVLRKTNRI